MRILAPAALALMLTVPAFAQDAPQGAQPNNNTPAANQQDQRPQDPAAPGQRAQPADDTARDQNAAELPATASPLALVGLMGVLALGGSLTLRRIRA